MLEKVAKGKLLERVKSLFDDATTYDREWQNNAQESFGFRDGYAQWTKEEKDILHEEMRPALTLNIIKSHIDLIKGLNEDIKQRYTATPVGIEDGFLCEVLNNVVYWLYEKNDYEGEEDNAYESALISGRGWIGLDYDINENNLQDIKITMQSIPVHEIRMDPAARKRDLSDASYIIWDKWLSLEDFVIKYPKFENKAREAFEVDSWPTYQLLDNLTPESGETLNHDINDESDYSDMLDVGYFNSKKRQIRVCHMEYWKYITKYFVYNVDDGKLVPLNIPFKTYEQQFKALFPDRPLQYETQTVKEVWWVQFCGEEILFHGKSPINYPGFSVVPCFLFDDVSRRNGYHYGIVELMKDPQREINKRTSQTLNLFNQQVQPGLYAESRAFQNVDQAEQSVKESGSITWLQDGAIGQKRFMERSVPAFPSAVLQMGEYAREMVRHITGINPDLLGMNDKRQEPGIVVQLRQQQGMAILKPVFKAYSKMREELFKRLVAIVMSHMPTQQVLKILGEPGRFQENDGILLDSKTGLQADLRNTDMMAYDIDTEPETASLTQNALELATFMEMGQNGIPVDPFVMISKTNLSASEKLQWIDYIEKQSDQAAQQAEHEMQMQMQENERKYEIEMAKIQLQRELAGMKAEFQREKDILKVSADQAKLDAQIKRDKQSAQIKATQIFTQATLGSQKEQREWMDMMLRADIDKKRLMLDTVEVMAQSKNQQTQASVKAVLDMYKMALDTQNMSKERELKFAQSVMDAYVKMDVEDNKLALAKDQMDIDASDKILSHSLNATDIAMRSAVDVEKSKASDSVKLATEALKAKSAEKIAERQAKASEVAAKENAKAAKEGAKQNAQKEKTNKPL